uniref:Serine-threonine/tyrosine-protein kinase catalytic domain-containing protein n=1 Tax=Brassica oleracea var. oleracea TaxID=109376 RepID=A0A0D3DLM9_BRAOL
MSGVEPKVAVATNINPKLVGGSSSTSTKYGGVMKIETLTLSELNAYITSPHRYCNEESKMIVVYEYMKKGMLKDHLFRKSHCTLRVKYASVLGNNSSEIPFSSEIPRNFPTEFRGNKFLRKLRGPPVRRKSPRNISRENVLGIYLGSDEMNPRKIPRNKGPSVYSEEHVPRYYVGAQIDPSIPNEKVNLIEWAMMLVKKGKIEKSWTIFLMGRQSFKRLST